MKFQKSLHQSTSDYQRSIIWGIGIFYALSFAVSVFFGWKNASTELNASLTDRLLETTTTKALSIDLYIDRIKAVSRSYARAIERTVPPGEQVSPLMLDAFRSEAGVSALYYGDKTGKFVSDLSWTIPEGYDPRQRPWYQLAAEIGSNDEPVYSGVYRDLATNSLAISFATPIRCPNGSLRGVLAADVLLSTLALQLNIEGGHFPGYAFLIDANGVFLVNPAEYALGHNLSEIEEDTRLANEIMNGSLSLIDFHDKRGRIALTAKLPNTGWILGLVTEKKKSLEPLYQLGWNFFILFVVSLLLIIGSSRVLARKLTAFAKNLEVELGIKNVELRDKIREIEKMSVTDALTGIANRRFLDNQLSTELLRTRRHRKSFSLILFDIDLFKQINDRFGHNAGDEVLQALTTLVGRHIRDTDILGRWGGEEFLILCPSTGKDGAKKLAEKIRLAVQTAFSDHTPPITCSFGCVCSKPGETPTQLVSRADAAMYRAKNAGRNQVVCE